MFYRIPKPHMPLYHAPRVAVRHNHYNPHHKEDRGLLKFVYKYDDIYEEVYKRTSFLAKHRGTEQLLHQLGTMSFTRDEEFMFKPFIQEAAANIYEKLYPFSKFVKDGYVYREHINTEKWERQPDVRNSVWVGDGEQLTATLVERDQALGSTWKLVAVSNVDVKQPVDYKRYGYRVTATLTYSLDKVNRLGSQTIHAINSDPELTFNRSHIKRDIVMSQDLSARKKHALVWETTVFVPNDERTSEGLEFATFDSVKINSIALVSKETPKHITRGTYIEDGDDLYRVIGDVVTVESDIHDPYQFERVSVDERDAVVFTINVLDWMDENAFGLTDNAIFEAIVNYVMCSWFMNVAPAEAELHSTKYTKALTDIVHRINAQRKPVRRHYNLY